MTHPVSRFQNRKRVSPWRGLLMAVVLCLGCGRRGPLTVEMPLHLEDHLGAAKVVGSAVPANPPQPVEWRFDQPQPQWTSARLHPSRRPVLTRTEDGLRVSLREANRFLRGPGNNVGPPPPLGVSIYIDLPDWVREDWAYIQVRARTSEHVRNVGIGFNLVDRPDTATRSRTYRYGGESAIVVRDGSVQTYLLRADWSGGRWHGPWRQLGLTFSAQNPASIDLLSVSVVPKDAGYTAASAGVQAEVREGVHRRTLYTHAPGRVEYRVRVPEAGRLDVGLAVLRDDVPVTFRITAGPDSAPLLEETIRDKEHWAQRTVDLSRLAGRTVTLALEASAERAGTVALWGAPTVTGARHAGRPNVIFYVIDGGGADYMSVYGYSRRTTPNLERLAGEGALFEHAYSNSDWTQPSTASFMTSLQHSVLGATRSQVNPVPEQAVTMAEHMHRAGYQTGVFIANPNAGTLQSLHRGVDVMREGWSQFSYFGGEGAGNYKESSRFLSEEYWRWREAYPGTPYWVHFQSTDVHSEFPAVAPFAGLFVSPEQVRILKAWGERLGREGGGGIYSEAWERTGISRVEAYSVEQGLYDETMVHNDYQLGRLVDRLKAAGEWDNTLLIIGADHSTRAAWADAGIANRDSLPPRWSQPMFRPSISRVPLIVVWPGHIRGGQRFSQQVSMIDVLPTILDLLDLPAPEVAMGQSLAPLLLGHAGWAPRPVILENFRVDPDSDQVRGHIEVVDGRWGASLEINPSPTQPPEFRRPVPLLLYDLWSDPWCLRSLHEQRPDLVRKYTTFLEAQREAHRALAQRFTRSGQIALTPEQLQMLRSLGYIR